MLLALKTSLSHFWLFTSKTQTNKQMPKFARICPNFARILTSAKILVGGGGSSAPCPTPISYAYMTGQCVFVKIRITSSRISVRRNSIFFTQKNHIPPPPSNAYIFSGKGLFLAAGRFPEKSRKRFFFFLLPTVTNTRYYTTNELDPMKWSILLPRCDKKLPLPEPKARVMVIFITSR